MSGAVVAPAFAAVESLFRTQVREERLHPGAALTVVHHGQVVLDLIEGLADTQTGQPVERDTMFVLFSSTKPLASVAVLQQVERGRIGLDDTVASVWPGFAANGKDAVTVRHILTHRGGFPATPASFSTRLWGDWDEVVRAMEGCEAQYPPGTTNAYHAINHGWVCAEIVRRLDGRMFDQYLREEITGPLGMVNTHVGLPEGCEGRVAKVHATEDTGDFWVGRAFNRVANLRAIVPAANGVSTAHDMARFYTAVLHGGGLDGRRILKPETVAMATSVEVDAEPDVALGYAVRRGLGLNLGGMDGPGVRMGTASTRHTFGHGGAGTSICWADSELDAAMVFIPNGFREDRTNVPRSQALSDAVRAACQG